MLVSFVFFQAEDGIRDLVRSRGLGDVYKRQHQCRALCAGANRCGHCAVGNAHDASRQVEAGMALSLIHI